MITQYKCAILEEITKEEIFRMKKIPILNNMHIYFELELKNICEKLLLLKEIDLFSGKSMFKKQKNNKKFLVKHSLTEVYNEINKLIPLKTKWNETNKTNLLVLDGITSCGFGTRYINDKTKDDP